MNEPTPLNGHRGGSEGPKREPDRSLLYEILREFRALGARDE